MFGRDSLGDDELDDVAAYVQYLRDPDDNGVELYWDRPPGQWPRTPGGELAMFTRRLDLDGLLREVNATTDAPKIDEGPRDL